MGKNPSVKFPPPSPLPSFTGETYNQPPHSETPCRNKPPSCNRQSNPAIFPTIMKILLLKRFSECLVIGVNKKEFFGEYVDLKLLQCERDKKCLSVYVRAPALLLFHWTGRKLNPVHIPILLLLYQHNSKRHLVCSVSTANGESKSGRSRAGGFFILFMRFLKKSTICEMYLKDSFTDFSLFRFSMQR